MYTKYFGLSEKPFSITPDPHFLFLSERHAEALAHLVYGVTESGGFIQLTGEVGTGKTTLTRCLLDRLPDTVDLAIVLNPRLSVKEFLATIFDELGIDAPYRDATTKELVDTLNHHLLQSHANGRRTVLLVDEAQNLDIDVLEQLRLLTNLETSKDKLLQIILVGQPELRDILGRNDLRQLAQRITGRYHLENLSPEETVAYVKHRMQVAGATTEVFDPGALWEVHSLTQGSPRLINVICDRALLGAFSEESTNITRKTVRAAAAEVQGAPLARQRENSQWVAKAAMGAAVLMMLSFAGWGIARIFTADSNDSAQTANVGTAQETVYRSLQLNTVDTNSASGIIAASDGTAIVPSELRLSMAQSMGASLPSQASNSYTSLSSLLNNPDYDTSTDLAFDELFSLWGVTAEIDRSAPCNWVKQYQLKCEFLVGSTRLINAINRPVILSLVDDSGQLHNAVVVRANTDFLTLRLDGREFDIGMVDISRYWYGEFLTLWRPQEGVDSLLLPGTSSDEIVWLRSSLARISHTVVRSQRPRYYDSNLRDIVIRFQRANGLEADGKVGLQTLIAINSALNIAGTPFIRTDNTDL